MDSLRREEIWKIVLVVLSDLTLTFRFVCRRKYYFANENSPRREEKDKLVLRRFWHRKRVYKKAASSSGRKETMLKIFFPKVNIRILELQKMNVNTAVSTLLFDEKINIWSSQKASKIGKDNGSLKAPGV